MNNKNYATNIISSALAILRDEKIITQEDYKEVTNKLNEAINKSKKEGIYLKKELKKQLPGDGVSQEVARKKFLGVTGCEQ